MCFQKGAVDLIQAFMQEIEDRELSGEVVISNTGCFGICDKGPVVVVYPEGVWYGNVSGDDVERIFDEHFEGGEPVHDLMI
jgi:(2Fe-2S) ferredoxin